MCIHHVTNNYLLSTTGLKVVVVVEVDVVLVVVDEVVVVEVTVVEVVDVVVVVGTVVGVVFLLLPCSVQTTLQVQPSDRSTRLPPAWVLNTSFTVSFPENWANNRIARDRRLGM